MIRRTHFQSGGFDKVGSSPSIIYLKDTLFIKQKGCDNLYKITVISHRICTEEIATC
jgi:hypothetical protein